MTEPPLVAGSADDAPWAASWLADLEPVQRPNRALQLRNESGRRVLLDKEFQDWLTDSAVSVALRKRAKYCLQELLVQGRCGLFKTVKGPAKGWLRTGLGGTGGSHYYLWWAPYGHPPVKGAGLDEGDVLVRCVRHHDATSQPLDAGDPSDRHQLIAEDCIGSDDSPFTAEQLAVAAPLAGSVRLVKGYPGSGKTTGLWLAGSEAWGRKALYLTFSRGLAEGARARFETFGPVGTAIDVLTFDDLLRSLGAELAAGVGGTSAGEAAVGLEVALSEAHQPSGPWAGRWQELYAELHAHLVGSALPIVFRGMPPTTGSLADGPSFLGRRSPAIGTLGAQRALALAKEIPDPELGRLFGGPWWARRLLDDHSSPLPERFEGVTSVLVDEVQDLTMVEMMLLLVLVLRIGHAEGLLPNVILAGDEAQTVRPTDFQWVWLNDLVTTVLGEHLAGRDDVVMSSNLRSPGAVAAVVEGSRLQYQLLPKELRPSGLSSTTIPEGDGGRVIYCRAEDEAEWLDLARFFSEQPDAQLVFPGHDVPGDLVGDGIDIATSEQVKGLDYRTVGLVDAGRRHREIVSLAGEVGSNPVLGLWARTIADQFRVGVSRAKETLVFLDRGPDDFTDDIRELCGQGGKHLRVTSPEELMMELDEEAEPEDRVQGQLAEAERVLFDDPTRALRLARTAQENARSAAVGGDGAAQLTLADASRLRGVAAAIVAESAALGERTRLFGEAAEHLELAGHGDLYQSVVASRALSSEQGGPSDVLDLARCEQVLAVVADLPGIRIHLRELETGTRSNLTAWLELALDSDLPPGLDALPTVIESMSSVAEVLSSGRPELSAAVRARLDHLAEAARDSGEHERALCLYEQMEDAPADLVAVTLEDLHRWSEASDTYESLGRAVDALRCAREIPDLQRAAVLAETIDPALADRLRWALQIGELLGPQTAGTGEPLTRAEHDALLELVTQGLAASLESTPSTDLPAVEPAATDPPDPAPEVEPAVDGAPQESKAPISLADLAAELSLPIDETIALCHVLGVPADNAGSRIAALHAQRVRRRAARSQT